MILYIVRHAWAGQHGDPAYPNDDLRPLTPKGEKRFRRVAKRLVKRGFAPKVIATSPLVRCRQTAEVLMDRLSDQGTQLETLDALAPGAHVRGLWNWLIEHADEDIALVGHAPDVETIAAELIGGGRIEFAKGAVAAIEFADGLDSGDGRLKWLATADILGG